MLSSQQQICYVIMLFAAAILFVARDLQRSEIGRAFVAMRDNDLAKYSE